MRVCITTINREVGDYVYDLLTNPLSGHGCLRGSKSCLDDHNMVPDIMEFDLNHHEIEELQKIEGVIKISPSDIGKPTLNTTRRLFKVRTPDVIYRNASYTYADNVSTTARPRTSPSQAGLNLGPSYQYYATNHDPSYTQLNAGLTNNVMTSAFSVDCREVDIIILDTGVDPSCEDLKTMYGENLVQIFDWTQVVDGFYPFYYYTDDLGQEQSAPNYVVYQDIPQGAAPSIANYYVDWIGHGTECASIAAGLKCGLAKNARIFSLNVTELGAPFGYSFNTCLKLVAGFLLGKKNGWYGLNPSTPTILSCSWTIEGPSIAGISYVNLTPTGNSISNVTVGPIGIPAGRTRPISAMFHNIQNASTTGYKNVDAYNNDGLLASSLGLGGVRLNSDYITAFPCSSAVNQPFSRFANNLPASNDVVDGYMRIFTENGMHVVVCAGNNNIDLNQKNPDIIPILLFREKTLVNGVWVSGTNWAVLRQMVLDSSNQKYVDNASGLVVGQDYTIGTGTYTFNGTLTTWRNYISPDIGVESANPNPATPSQAWTRENFPLIKVGCVTPLGNVDEPTRTFDSGGYTRSVYDLLIHPYPVKWMNFMRAGGSPAGVLDCSMAGLRPIGSSPTTSWSILPQTINGSWTPIEVSQGIRFTTPTINAPDVGILYNDGTNNKNLSYRLNADANGLFSFVDPPYVKSPYSNFGPAVDIYAVGSATWAGVSNQMVDPSASMTQGRTVYYSETGSLSANNAAPYFREGLFKNVTSLNNNLVNHGGLYNGKYKFANGTSSACPAVVGCLATFLAQYPRATPLEAKRWLESSSVKGKILTTHRTPFLSSLSGFNSSTPNVPGAFGVTFGSGVSSVNFGSMGYNHNLTIFGQSSSFVTANQVMFHFPFGGNATLEAGGRTHFVQTDYFRNTNYFWTSAFYNRYFSNDSQVGALPRTFLLQNNQFEFNFPLTFAYLQNFFFQCRFFSDSKNRIAQAHPLRSAVLFARTGTAYASSIYFNQFNLPNQFNIPTFSTRLQIWNQSAQFPTLSAPNEYRIGNQAGSVNVP